MTRKEFFIKLSMMAEITCIMVLLIGATFILSAIQNVGTEKRSAYILSKLEEPSRQYVIEIDGQQIPVAEYDNIYYVRENGETNMEDSYQINGKNGVLKHTANGKEEYFSEWSIQASSDKETL